MLITMKSLSNGPTQVRTVRIPEPLWTRLTEWAQRAGVGDSEALRLLLAMGLDSPAPVQRRTPMPWMSPDHAYVQVPPGSDWWDLDDVVGCLPGARRHTGPRHRQSDRWWEIPREGAGDIESLFAGRPERVRLHVA